MLLDDLYAFPKGVYRLPGNVDMADVLKPTQERAKSAQAMVLDEDAIAMAVSVWMSKPSSILTALNWVNLPYETTWIEFENADLRESLVNAGHLDPKTGGRDAHIERTGVLLWRDEETIVADFVRSIAPLQKPDAMHVTDLMMTRLFFSPEPEKPGEARAKSKCQKSEARAKTDFELNENIVGKFRHYMTQRNTDPIESAAYLRLRGMMDFESHEDWEKVINHQFFNGGLAQTVKFIRAHRDEMMQIFEMAILPALILLNCKNAVDIEKNTYPEKLNKHRLKKGKAPFQDHYVVKMHLNPRMREQIMSAGKSVGVSMRATLVASHFKVRKTGVFLWRSFPRGSGPFSPKTIIVTS